MLSLVIAIRFYEGTLDVFFGFLLKRNFIIIQIIQSQILLLLANTAKIGTRFHNICFLNLTLTFDGSVKDHFAAIRRTMLASCLGGICAVASFGGAMIYGGFVLRRLGLRNSIPIIRLCVSRLVI